MGSGQAHTGFWWGNLKERDHLEDGRVMHLVQIGRVNVDWNELAQDRDKWRAFVNTVTILRVP